MRGAHGCSAWLALHPPKLQPRHVRHPALVPRRIPHHVHLHRADARERAHLPLHVFLEAVGNPRGGPGAAAHPLAPDGTVATPHGAPVVRKSETVVGAGRLLTAREVADRLAVCTATIYALCERGEIQHLRVSNAIRIHPDDLEAFIAGRRRV